MHNNKLNIKAAVRKEMSKHSNCSNKNCINDNFCSIIIDEKQHPQRILHILYTMPMSVHGNLPCLALYIAATRGGAVSSRSPTRASGIRRGFCRSRTVIIAHGPTGGLGQETIRMRISLMGWVMHVVLDDDGFSIPNGVFLAKSPH